ncbi:bifunctional folylpolyglutamate synthase/dihydrofolate synthase [Clostridia bacterium]|nr:bifunctional folylpolyglutamate synthase/dihydrofolate synthase [Clostridia bacterium]
MGKFCYEDCEQYFSSTSKSPVEKNAVHTLKALLLLLGNPQKEKKIIHVAGTNGKGSVCAYLSTLLREIDKDVGCFISPHLVDIRERFCVNLQLPSKQICAEAFADLKAAQQLMGIELTFFETAFFLALLIFRQKNVEYIVLETGIGGRQDTTNILTPILSIITSISLDHTDVLGNSLEEITKEKMGILKSGVPVVYDASHTMVDRLIRQEAQEKELLAIPIDTKSTQIQNRTKKSICFIADQEEFTLPFFADYQVINALLALEATKYLPERWTLSQKKKALATTVWKGRMQYIQDGIYLDGAHNEAATKACIRQVKILQSQNLGEIRLIFAVAKEKQIEKIVSLLSKELLPEEVYLPKMGNTRMVEPQHLQELFSQHGVNQVKLFFSVKEAYIHALSQKRSKDLILILGSLYLVGEMIALKHEETH